MNSKIFHLIYASEYRDVEKLLQKGADPNEEYRKVSDSEENGITPIFAAIDVGSLTTVELLIRYEANINYRIPVNLVAHEAYSETPLGFARKAKALISKEQYAPIVEILEKNGANELLTNYGESSIKAKADTLNKYITFLSLSIIGFLFLGAILGKECIDHGTAFSGCFFLGIEFGPLIYLSVPIIMALLPVLVIVDLIGRSIYRFIGRSNET